MPGSNGGCGNPRNWRGIWLLFTGQKHWGKRMMQIRHPVHQFTMGGWNYRTKPPWRAPRTLLSTSTFGKVVIEETRTRQGQEDQDSAAQRWRSGHPTSKQLRSVEVLVERKRNLGLLAEGRDGGYRYGLGPATAGKSTASLTAIFSLWRAPRSTLNQ